MAKVITLSKGYVALVDDEDYDALSNHKWQASKSSERTAYARRVIQKAGERETIYMHDKILGLKGVDHISHDLLRFNLIDNRKENLRPAGQSLNQANQRKQSRTLTSKYKGVHWYGRYGRWEVQIKVEGRKVYLGRFYNEKAAARAYDLKTQEAFGEFALTNQAIYPEDFKEV
jgi:hypothetical protein